MRCGRESCTCRRCRTGTIKTWKGRWRVIFAFSGRRHVKAKVYHQINLAAIDGWAKNYRIPDLVLLLPQRFAIDRNEYFEGAPDVVVEIHSPGDETYEKLLFYRDLGVPEVWVIQRDSRQPEIHVLKRGRYKKQAATAQGWIRSPGTGIELAEEKGKLAVRLAGDDSTRQDLPPD